MMRRTRRATKPETRLLFALGAIDSTKLLEHCLNNLGFVGAADALRQAVEAYEQASAAELEPQEPLDSGILRKALVEAQPGLSKALLRFGVEWCRWQLVDTLLIAGAPVDAAPGESSLLEVLAAKYCSDSKKGIQVAQRLVAAGCPLNGRSGPTALGTALMFRSYYLVKALLELGARVEESDSRYYRYLINVVDDCICGPRWTDYILLARMLVEAGAPINTHAQGGEPLLAHLVKRLAETGLDSEKPLDLLECLLELGADPIAGTQPLPHLLCASLGPRRVHLGHLRRLLRTLSAAGAGLNLLAPQFGPFEHMLHFFVINALGARMREAPSLLRVLLEEGADVAQASAMYPSPLDILISRLATIGLVHEPLPTCAPELIRILVDAGCAVSSVRPDIGLVCPANLNFFMYLIQIHIQQQHPDSPSSDITEIELEIAQVLLDATAREHAAHGGPPPPEDDLAGSLLDVAVLLGSVRLVRIVLDRLPSSVRASMAKSRLSPEEREAVTGCREEMGALGAALSRLRRQLYSIPAPQQDGWTALHAQPVFQFYTVVRDLLEAGAVPAPLMQQGRRAASLRPRRRCSAAARAKATPVPQMVTMLPAWAQGPLSFLPLVVNGRSWSPEFHTIFPRTFQQAARMLLLINNCRGFGRGRKQVQPQERRRCSARNGSTYTVRQQRGKGSGAGSAAASKQLCRGVVLPPDVLHGILQLAADPVLEWVLELQPFLAVGQDERF